MYVCVVYVYCIRLYTYSERCVVGYEIKSVGVEKEKKGEVVCKGDRKMGREGNSERSKGSHR